MNRPKYAIVKTTDSKDDVSSISPSSKGLECGFSRSRRSYLVHFIQSQSELFSQNSLSDKQTNSRTQSTHRKARLEPAIRDAQKVGQNVFSALNVRMDGQIRFECGYVWENQG